MASEKLCISYAGTLIGHDPETRKLPWVDKLQSLIWDYYPKTCYPYTRSGYYLFKGIQVFKKSYPSLYPQIEFHIWGNIKPLNQIQVEKFSISEVVRISGFIPKNETESRLKDTDILFLPLESSIYEQPPLFIPGKLYEYLQYKKPILGLMEGSDAKDILDRSKLGYVVSPFDPSNIANALKFLVENKDNLDRIFEADSAYIDSLNFANTTKRMSCVFDKFGQ